MPEGQEYAFAFDARDRRQPVFELNEQLAPLAKYDFVPRRDLPYGELVRRKFYGYKGRTSGGGKQTVGNTHYYHTDNLGTVWKMTNHQGQEIFSYDYDAWGNLQNEEFTKPYAPARNSTSRRA